MTHNAWDDDCTRNTKSIFSSRSEDKRDSVLFALNCGILFSDLNSWNLSQAEKEPFDKYVDALLKLKEKNLSKADEENANEQLNESMNKLWEVVNEPDRVSQLFSLAEDKVQLLEEKEKRCQKLEREIISSRYTKHFLQLILNFSVETKNTNQKSN